MSDTYKTKTINKLAQKCATQKSWAKGTNEQLQIV